MLYTRYPVWSVLLRLFHWCFALSIVVLVTTGLYIHMPWTNTLLEGTGRFPVAQMRYVHFIAAFVFIGALLARLFLLLVGNRQERIWDFLPVTQRNIRNLAATLKYYIYLTDREDHRSGHNALAGIVYTITFVLAGLQILSGLYLLYPETVRWQSWGVMVFGSQQQARFVHYLLMWYFILFAFTHIYIVIWNDVRSGEGLISSIFTGRKYRPQS